MPLFGPFLGLGGGIFFDELMDIIDRQCEDSLVGRGVVLEPVRCVSGGVLGGLRIEALLVEAEGGRELHHLRRGLVGDIDGRYPHSLNAPDAKQLALAPWVCAPAIERDLDLARDLVPAFEQRAAIVLPGHRVVQRVIERLDGHVVAASVGDEHGERRGHRDPPPDDIERLDAAWLLQVDLEPRALGARAPEATTADDALHTLVTVLLDHGLARCHVFAHVKPLVLHRLLDLGHPRIVVDGVTRVARVAQVLRAVRPYVHIERARLTRLGEQIAALLDRRNRSEGAQPLGAAEGSVVARLRLLHHHHVEACALSKMCGVWVAAKGQLDAIPSADVSPAEDIIAQAPRARLVLPEEAGMFAGLRALQRWDTVRVRHKDAKLGNIAADAADSMHRLHRDRPAVVVFARAGPVNIRAVGIMLPVRHHPVRRFADLVTCLIWAVLARPVHLVMARPAADDVAHLPRRALRKGVDQRAVRVSVPKVLKALERVDQLAVGMLADGCVES
mmetsp:Transcript_76929/g.152609  ORF Transcript_76929/g.152609 Transcript_76929/m.152609 type:complete len:503 (-) Transcript_76929:158-1666(-)